MCDEPDTLAELMAVADKYATADSAMNVKVTIDADGKLLPVQPAPPKLAGDNNQCRQDNSNGGKRRNDQQAPRYDNRQVAVVEGEQPAEQGSSQHPRTGKAP